MPIFVRALVFALAGVAAAAGTARAGYVVPDGFVDEPVVGGLDQPVNLAVLPDGRTLVIERIPARVRLVVNGTFPPIDPVLTVDSVQTNDGERGLLGIAIDPAWPARPYVYLYYDHLGGPWIRLSRFRAQGDLEFTDDGQLVLDPTSRFDVLSHIPDANPVHNGGTLRFGPDGMLYVALGDDNVPCHALDRTVLRGKILRLDVSGIPDGPGGNPSVDLLAPADNPFAAHPHPNARLVWAYGLRNPYSFAIDPLDGSLLIADVGAASYEEINFAPSGGLNFQWPIYEGPRRSTIVCGLVDSSQWTPPVHWYDRTAGATVIAGFVYRRPPGAPTGFPLDHEGSFFFTDFYFGYLRRLVPEKSGAWVVAPAVPGQPGPLDWGSGRTWVSSFQQAPDGSVLYTQNWTSYPQPDGQLRRIRRAFVTGVEPVGDRGPSRPTLAVPWPNPSRGDARIAFSLPAPGPGRVTLHDARGRLVRVLAASATWPAGSHRASWDGLDAQGRPAPAGVYRLRLQAGDRVDTGTLVHLGPLPSGHRSRLRP
jgi:glucose/arabinose dehydrogenase